VRAGSCNAGYYCDFGAALPNQGAQVVSVASSTTSTGSAETSAAAQEVLLPSKKCPRGHYCLAGAQYPTRCGAGKYTSTTGTASAAECQDCPAGAYCRAKDNTAMPCPKGHWCRAGAEVPAPCWAYTYNPLASRTSSDACLACPAGSFCSVEGTSDYRAYLCPPGHYCPYAKTRSPSPCPSGTYVGKPGAATLEECLPCPEGFACPEATAWPQPCQNGTYCPAGSGSATECRPGTYCPALAREPSVSPAAFYQPQRAADFYSHCPNGTYCIKGASAPTTCPAGHFGTGSWQNVDYQSGCAGCDPGFFAVAGENAC